MALVLLRDSLYSDSRVAFVLLSTSAGTKLAAPDLEMEWPMCFFVEKKDVSETPRLTQTCVYWTGLVRLNL